MDKIIDEIYDPKIEKPEYQTMMRSCIKAWLREAYQRGFQAGKEELALKLRQELEREMNPGAAVCIIEKDK